MTKTLNTSTLKLVQIIHVDFGHITQVIWTTFLMLVLSFDSIYSALIHCHSLEKSSMNILHNISFSCLIMIYFRHGVKISLPGISKSWAEEKHVQDYRANQIYLK